MQCPRCRTENPEDAKFCKECGLRLVAPGLGPPPVGVGYSREELSALLGEEELSPRANLLAGLLAAGVGLLCILCLLIALAFVIPRFT